MVLSLTESLPGTKVLLSSKENIPQALIRAICNRRVNDEDQAGLETSPQSRPAVLTVDNFLARVNQALLVALWLRLLSRGNNRNGNGEDLSNSTCHGTKTELNSSARGLGNTVGLHVEGPHNAVPIEIGKVGRGNTYQGTGNARVQSTDTLTVHNLLNSIHSRVVDSFVGLSALRFA